MEWLVRLAVGLLKHLGLLAVSLIHVCCIGLDIGDKEDGVLICTVGSVAGWC